MTGASLILATQTQTESLVIVGARQLSPLPNRCRFCHVERSLAFVTIYGHNMTMKQVRIADLKARLSEYLRAVRGGETIAVLDRDTPVAQLVPIRGQSALRVRKPAPGTPPPNRVRLPKPAKVNLDVVQLLLEERQGHR